MKIINNYLIYSIFITLSFLYILYPNPKIILLKPNIDDENSIVYKDDKNVCYRYNRKEIPCNK